MNKDAYWFRHDSNSSRTLKMKKLQHIYGLWSTGAYWSVVEVLREQSGYKFPCDETSLQMLSEIIGEKDPIKFQNWFNDCVRIGLFEKEQIEELKAEFAPHLAPEQTQEQIVFFSHVLCKNMAIWEQMKLNGSKGGRPKNEQGEEKELNQSNNPNETIIEEYNIKTYKKNFEDFRKNYAGRKLGFEIEFKNFQRHKDWETILPSLNEILIKQKKIRAAAVSAGQWFPAWKNLKTWINQRCWEEEPETPVEKASTETHYETARDSQSIFGEIRNK